MLVDDEALDLIYAKAGVEGPLHFWWNDPVLVREAWVRSRTRKDFLERFRFSQTPGGPATKERPSPCPIW